MRVHVIVFISIYLQLQDLPFVQIRPDGVLIISGTQEIDAGEYECVATNEAGFNSAFVTLEIGCSYICNFCLVVSSRKCFHMKYGRRYSG